LTEINLYTAIIHQCVVHFEISLHGLLFFLKLGESILQRLTRALVSNNFYFHCRIESTEDEFQIFVLSDGVELANKQHIFGGFNVGVGQIT
jgi:hypothetical protein